MVLIYSLSESSGEISRSSLITFISNHLSIFFNVFTLFLKKLQNKINKCCYTIIIRTYFRHYLLVKIWSIITTGISTGGGEGVAGRHPSNWISEPNKVQQFQFQTSGMLLFVGVQKLCGPEILSMLQFSGNFRTSFHFFYLHKGSTSLHVAPSGKA